MLFCYLLDFYTFPCVLSFLARLTKRAYSFRAEFTGKFSAFSAAPRGECIFFPLIVITEDSEVLIMKIPDRILTRKDEITVNFLNILNEHIDAIIEGRVDHMYRIKDFASRMFIHPTHLSNTIKLTTGKSPCDFMEERIVLEAKKMLSETSMTVAEICYRLTFHEPTNFTKFFKTMTGETPSSFRKKIIESENLTFK
jgi:AraC-like DNA-binding protein